MIAGSPPLRFIVLVLAGWTAVRTVMLWPVPAASPSQHASPAAGLKADAAPRPWASGPEAAPTPAGRSDSGADRMRGWQHAAAVALPVIAPAPRPAPAATAIAASAVQPPPALAIRPATPAGGAGAAPAPSRLTGYAWAFARDGDGRLLVPGAGQLGGSQAGLALAWRATDALSLTARVSTPLESGRGKEAALGIAWRPLAGIAAELAAERRVALDSGGRDAFAVSLRGGVSALALPLDFRLDAWGQAGAVGLDRRDGFIDGQAVVTRHLAGRGPLRLAAGAGLWGAAQPGAQRIDIGPELVMRLKAGPADLRLSAGWRLRIAGDARPGSGPAVTLSQGF